MWYIYTMDYYSAIIKNEIMSFAATWMDLERHTEWIKSDREGEISYDPATLWTVAHQAPLSMGFSRQEYWSGLPFPSPGDLPDPGTEPSSSTSPTLQEDSLPLSHWGSPWSQFRCLNPNAQEFPLAVQWLGNGAFIARAQDRSLVRGLRSRKSHSAAK